MYQIQCVVGHAFEVPPDTALERQCIEREENGFPDPPILSEAECPVCENEREAWRYRSVRLRQPH